MVIGMIITACAVWLYSKKETLKNLTGSKYNYRSLNEINPEFATYISAFTSGYVSSGSPVRIKFSSDLAGNAPLNTPLDKELFDISPGIEGEATWKDPRTLEFKPKDKLTPGQKYEVSFNLHELIDVKKELEEFNFQFEVIRQSLQLQAGALRSYSADDFEYYSLMGNVVSADHAISEEIEETLSAKLDNSDLKIKWVHGEKGTTHQFLLDSIERPTLTDSKLTLSCDGKPISVNYTSEQVLKVPVKYDFEILNVETINDQDQCIVLNLSNPVNKQQSLQGLITVEGRKEVKYIVNNNQVLVYTSGLQAGSHKLTVNSAVRDGREVSLDKDQEFNVVFNEVMPAVRFTSSGNILPSGGGQHLPFETVNLRAVDVKIIKIYENNVLQFLQSNTLEGTNYLAHVGKQVLEKRINLGITSPAELSAWKKSSLDLSELIKTEPGAIYRVIFNFQKEYASYPCAGGTSEESFEMQEIREKVETDQQSYFGYYDDYEYYEYDESEEEENSYENRNNPCKNAYYNSYLRTVAKNVLATDIAITFKKCNDGSFFAVANDIITTKPLSGVSLEFYDFQKQLIHTEKTNSDGQAFIDKGFKPAFLVAKKDKQFTYLRLDEGGTLPLSMYEVGGESIAKGVKGFIYGERGVWRPGDSIFMTFILEDKAEAIPSDHPVAFDLYNPQGQLYKRQIANQSVDGFYRFTVVTDKNAPTGFWNAEVRIGSIKFNKSVRIETIMPNRLKIKVNVGDDKMLVMGENNTVKLHTNWLTGAVARNLNAKVGLALSSAKTEFPKFKNYIFDDQTARFDAQNLSVFDGNVNENGDASFPLNIDVQNAPGFLKAAFVTKVTEPGGAFSVDRFSMTYSPFKVYAGIKLPEGENKSGILYTEKDQYIEIATVDTHGNKVSRSNLKFELYKLNWRWWWDQYADEIANYSFDEYHKPVQTQVFSTDNGKAEVKVNIKNSEWGRYLVRVVDVSGGHSASTVTYFDWANWMDREGTGENKIISNMLNFSSDKTEYKNGEEIKITIPSPQQGRALVTIENGSRVLEAHWLETETASTVFKFKATAQMAPNIYVHVSLLQPHVHKNDLPIRMYGVIPITISDPETHLKPVIVMPDVLQPEKKVSITVSEENGKEMAFTLAVVDEGLLDLTRFKTPDPYPVFYAKEALGVKTWDIYDQVIGAYGADLERILSIGGDGSSINNDAAKANRFKPMVRFFGPYKVSKGGKKEVSFTMPMYVGSVRTMVIAGKEGSYGLAEKTTAVKAPLMILGTLPRVLSVTEEVKLPVSVFGGETNIGNAEITIEANDLVQIINGKTRNVAVNKDDEQMVTFDLKVKNTTGIAKIKITAKGGGYTTYYDMELDVRNPNPYQTSIAGSWLEAGKTLQQSIAAPGLPGTNSGLVELSTIPPMNLEDRLDFLISYPHGCVEQTTSQSFAQLYLSDIMDLSPERRAGADENIKAGIYRIRDFQLPGGGLSYWPGMSDPNNWGTVYAGHFMISAEKKGYALPSGFKKNWLSYMQSETNNFNINTLNSHSNDQLQAYRLYVLAFANSPAMGAMNLLRETKGLSPQAQWWLAGAYAEVGQIDVAEKIIAGKSTDIPGYRVNDYTYGSSERDIALILKVLCRMNKKNQAYEQLKKVSDFLSSKSWLSTQTTAFGLLSVADFIKRYGESSALQATCKVNGKEVAIKGKAIISQIPLDFRNGNATIEITNNGKGSLFARIITRGKPAIGSEKEESSNISASVTYKDMNGNEVDPASMVQGKNLMMTVSVRHLGQTGEINNLALTSYIPSGWEIHNSRMDDNEAALKNSVYTYQDIKDDKVFTYFDLRPGEIKTFNFPLNAAYEGRFYLPAMNVEAMYDNAIYSRNKGQWIKVLNSKTPDVSVK